MFFQSLFRRAFKLQFLRRAGKTSVGEAVEDENRNDHRSRNDVHRDTAVAHPQRLICPQFFADLVDELGTQEHEHQKRVLVDTEVLEDFRQHQHSVTGENPTAD